MTEKTLFDKRASILVAGYRKGNCAYHEKDVKASIKNAEKKLKESVINNSSISYEKRKHFIFKIEQVFNEEFGELRE